MPRDSFCKGGVATCPCSTLRSRTLHSQEVMNHETLLLHVLRWCPARTPWNPFAIQMRVLWGNHSWLPHQGHGGSYQVAWAIYQTSGHAIDKEGHQEEGEECISTRSAPGGLIAEGRARFAAHQSGREGSVCCHSFRNYGHDMDTLH